MKYTQKSNGNTAFYIIVAVCILFIGGASWFALSNYNKNANPTPNTSSKQNNSEYNNGNSAYNDTNSPNSNTSSLDVAKPVTDEPYESKTEAPKPTPVVYKMPVEGEIIKKFSNKELQYSATYKDMRIHMGVDIACEKNTAVSSCSSGKITAIENSAAYGNTVVIEHANGIVSKYSSLNNIPVKIGQTVNAGDIIGYVTTVPCESADQIHLHFEVLENGKSIDPTSLFK